MARFSEDTAAAIDAIKYLRIRSGPDHRFIAIWVVVVDGRVLVRSWNDHPEGWYRAFRSEPQGAIVVGEREVPVRAVAVRSKRLLEAAGDAYAAKYTTKANLPYTEGLRAAARVKNTLELVPDGKPARTSRGKAALEHRLDDVG